jgi:hypothetical protein
MRTEIIELTKLARPKRWTFGEFLVKQRVLDRFQLFRALQMQDRMPNARLGQCAVALGYLPQKAVEQMHRRFTETVYEAELETMSTEAFDRVPDIEIVPRR